MRCGRGGGRSDTAGEGKADPVDTVQSSTQAAGHAFPGATAFDDADVHVVAADQPDGDDRVAVRDRQTRKSTAPLPHQPVLLTLELQHVAAPARENEHGLVLAHQRGAVVRIAHHCPRRLQYLA